MLWKMSASVLASVSSIDKILLPSSSLLSNGSSSNGEHRTSIFGFIDDVAESEFCVASATTVSVGGISSRGFKNADGDSIVMEIWHLLVDESNTSIIVAAGDTCSKNRLSP